MVPGDEAGVHEGGEGLLVCAGFCDAFDDGAGGVADFEAHVPEGVEDALDEFLGAFWEAVGGAGEEEEEVDIGAGIKGAAAVSADGDEGEGGGWGFLAVEGGGEDGGEELVDDGGACLGNFDASGAVAVAGEDVLLMDFEEAFVEAFAL